MIIFLEAIAIIAIVMALIRIQRSQDRLICSMADLIVMLCERLISCDRDHAQLHKNTIKLYQEIKRAHR